jgi:prepilin-type N-terminal cleavage/methylation domain-containing protein
MGSQSHKESGCYSGQRAFTLIEIVVALTIIAVIAAVAIPTMKGLTREEETAAPLRALAEMVQEARQKAMHERRPYQIVFEHEAIHACEFSFPHIRREEFLKYLADLRTPPKEEEIGRNQMVRAEIVRDEFAAPVPLSAAVGRPLAKPAIEREPPQFKMPWTQTISLPPKTECSVLLWGDGEWDVLEGEKIRAWVFQPTGMASPARVRLRLGEAELETSFDALTGDVRGERSRLRTQQP